MRLESSAFFLSGSPQQDGLNRHSYMLLALTHELEPP